MFTQVVASHVAPSKRNNQQREITFIRPGSDKPESILTHPRQLFFQLARSQVGVQNDKAPPAITTREFSGSPGHVRHTFAQH